MRSIQYSGGRGEVKERYTKVESRRQKKSESIDPKHIREVFLLYSELNSLSELGCSTNQLFIYPIPPSNYFIKGLIDQVSSHRFLHMWLEAEARKRADNWALVNSKASNEYGNSPGRFMS